MRDISKYEGQYAIGRELIIRGKHTHYYIGSHGDIYSNRHEKYLKLKHIKNRYGYHVVNIYIDGDTRQFRVHRLVAMAYIPVPQKYLDAGLNMRDLEVNHMDGNKDNNDITNLEWSTSKENTNHAIRTGLRINKGEKFHSSKLKDADVHKICKLLEENKLTAKEIPEKIGPHCTIKMVHNIMYNGTWSDISMQYDLSKHTIENHHGASNLSEKQVNKICKLLQDTKLSYYVIADMCECTHHDVNHIKNGYTWRDVSKNYDFSHRKRKRKSKKK